MSNVKIGESLKRFEDQRFLTGHGRYIDDINLDGQARAVVVRAAYAHAIINAIDTSAALAMDGVLLVVTRDDWLREGFKPMPTKSGVKNNADGTPLKEPPRHALAIDRVRYVGEPVALVVAETLGQAQAAAEMVDIDYEELPAVTDPVEALKPGAPQLWDDIPNNLCLNFELGDKSGTEKAFAEADHVVSLDVLNNRVTAVPIETRGCVAAYDAAADKYTLWNASQNVHANRDTFAEVLNIDKSQLDHIAPDVGGGFGAKNSGYPEPSLCLYAAKRLGRPVKWINSRSESFLSDTHGRGQSSRVELALTKDGTFLGLRTTTVGGIGAYAWTVGPFTPTGGSARTQGGPYNFPAMFYSGKAVLTNTAPMDPYRGAGRPEATFQTERIVEYAARTLGFDPIELRRKNLMPKEMLPHKTPMGLDVDSGDFPLLFEETLKMAEKADLGALKAKAEAAGKKYGFAVAPYLECTGGGPKEHAGVTFNKDGSIDLAVGTSSTGMGHETSLAQILAANLGVDMERIQFRQSDTTATPLGGGHGGSRGMEVGGNAVQQAAQEIIELAKPVAARLLQSETNEVEFEDGTFKAGASSVSMNDVIDASMDKDKLPEGMDEGCLDHSSVFERGVISIPNGVHAAAVAVDPDTGTVEFLGYWVMDDFGTIINPMLADGQVMGGVAQGIGQALLEDIVYDPDNGQLVTGSLMDYGLPHADEIPNMEIGYYEGAPTKKNPLGVKGAGEAGCVGACPAVVNAVLDALKDYGVTHIDMPLTPQKVWKAIQAKGAFDPKKLLGDAA
ncbi:MAG TPA: carbon monoxide dehydrogenase [Rhodospirillaceae bacterium]|nr:carbon monoxide dehydrogenase [Rhodospirillaceae bacterium]|tara:strand:- start:13 stop:2373 length:2361 start_codon:yes stop_codon:yes gene_type:complete